MSASYRNNDDHLHVLIYSCCSIKPVNSFWPTRIQNSNMLFYNIALTRAVRSKRMSEDAFLPGADLPEES